MRTASITLSANHADAVRDEVQVLHERCDAKDRDAALSLLAKFKNSRVMELNLHEAVLLQAAADDAAVDWLDRTSGHRSIGSDDKTRAAELLKAAESLGDEVAYLITNNL